MTMKQMTLDGRSVPLDEVGSSGPLAHRMPPRLTPAQQEIIATLGVRGELRSVEAGTIAHAHRGYCAGEGSKWSGWKGDGLGCCPYAAADGLEAMKRLAARGLARRRLDADGRVAPGRWVLP